jgi:hypothetical protein
MMCTDQETTEIADREFKFSCKIWWWNCLVHHKPSSATSYVGTNFVDNWKEYANGRLCRMVN